MARCSACFSSRSSPASRSPWSATARRRAISSMSPTSPRRSSLAAEDRQVRRDLEPGRRQSAIGQSAGRAARRRRRLYSQAARRAGLHLGRISKIQRELGWEPTVSASRRASAACSPRSSIGATRRYGTRTRSPRRPTELVQVSWQTEGYEHDGRCKQERRTATRSGRPRRLRAVHRPAAARQEGDHVPRHVRPRASRARPPPALCQEQGRHPGREPDRRRAHHQGQFPPVRPAGAARLQSGGAGNGRLTSSSTTTRPRSEYLRSSSPIISPRATNILATACIRKHRRGEGRRRGLWRRDHLHAGRHRLFLLAHHRDRAAGDRHRKAAWR